MAHGNSFPRRVVDADAWNRPAPDIDRYARPRLPATNMGLEALLQIPFSDGHR